MLTWRILWPLLVVAVPLAGSELTALPALAGVPPPAPAGNILYGVVASDRTLTYASPGPIYDVIGDLIVNAGVTLIVEPGVTVRCTAHSDFIVSGTFPDKVEILVHGRLVATSSTAPIVICSSDGTAASWGELYVATEGACLLTNVVVSGATRFLRCEGSAELSSVSASSMGPAGVGVLATGNVTMTSFSVSEVGTGIRVAGGVTHITNSALSGITRIVDVTGGACELTQCTLEQLYLPAGGKKWITSVGSLTIRDCTITGRCEGNDNTYGIDALGGTLTLERSTVTNAAYAVHVGEGVSAVVRGNVLRARTSQSCWPGAAGLWFEAPVGMAADDSLNVIPNVIKEFSNGVVAGAAGSVIMHTVVDSCYDGIRAYPNGTVNYCTVVHGSGVGIWVGGGRVLNCISVQNAGIGIDAPSASYCDSWMNGGGNFNVPGGPGPQVAAFNPGFRDPLSDYRLGSSSLFLNYSNSDGQIGAYGPGPTVVGAPQASVVEQDRVLRAFPNPARQELTMQFAIPAASRVGLRVYDVSGRCVNTLLDAETPEGDHVVRWNLMRADGVRATSGVYFCELRVGSVRLTRRIVLLEH